MAQKPSIPKGMRDFNAEQVAKRTYIFDTIKSVFQLYGYQPIETPTMENLSSLMGKYGEEGDKLLFKVLNSGDFTRGVDMNGDNLSKMAVGMCEKGLRYDLTVPFARYVVQHQNQISFPFKRFQIQPVWRADRPQKGRYREFYQCDVDVVGSDSLLHECELIAIVGDVFDKLGIRAALKINNRKLLFGIAQYIGFPEKMVDITVAIDKLDKISMEGVEKELLERGLSQEAIEKLKPVLQLKGDNASKLEQLSSLLGDSQVGMKGVEEMREIFRLYDLMGQENLAVELDLSLARGLSYYTGAIFEVKALDHAIGSICGGGRYDELTAIFGLKGVSGVGISFGADRIYDVMEALELFPKDSIDSPKALFVNFGESEQNAILPMLYSLRKSGIAVELYPKADKLKKQFDYAQRKGIEKMVFIGTNELESGVATIKNIVEGTQCEVPISDLSTEICKI